MPNRRRLAVPNYCIDYDELHQEQASTTTSQNLHATNQLSNLQTERDDDNAMLHYSHII